MRCPPGPVPTRSIWKPDAAMLQSDDLKAAMIAGMTKTEAKFSKL